MFGNYRQDCNAIAQLKRLKMSSLGEIPKSWSHEKTW